MRQVVRTFSAMYNIFERERQWKRVVSTTSILHITFQKLYVKQVCLYILYSHKKTNDMLSVFCLRPAPYHLAPTSRNGSPHQQLSAPFSLSAVLLKTVLFGSLHRLPSLHLFSLCSTFFSLHVGLATKFSTIEYRFTLKRLFRGHLVGLDEVHMHS